MKIKIISAFFLCLAILLMKVKTGSTVEKEPVVDVVTVTPKVRSYSMSIVDTTTEEESEVELKSRVVRSSMYCQLPADYGDSEIACQRFPTYVTCVQTCVFGHSFRSGEISKHYECRYGQWTPSQPFQKCYPFMDMTLTVLPGGKTKCWYNFMDHGPICEIECSHYEDMLAVRRAFYMFSHHGGWTPSLPFCTQPGSNVALLPAPHFSNYNYVK